MLTPYRSPSWLPGPHLQTIYPAAWMRLPHVDYRREQWDTPDGDFIELDWTGTDQAEAPLVVLFHGLEGNSRSHYALRLMALMQHKKWRGVVVHFRGCGGSPNLQPRGYHCGDSAEIDWILRRLRSQHGGPIYVVGVSLGGNTLLKWLGEQQHAASSVIDKAAAISAPVSLPTTGHLLGRGFNKVYTRRFLKTLRPKALAMITRHRMSFDSRAIRSVRNLWHYDNLFTAPLHGFKDADDYWQQSNSRPFLKKIQLPTLLLNARNDPFLPERDLPTADEVSASVVCDFPKHGGHGGFASPTIGGGVANNRQDWLPERIVTFFETGQ